MCQCLFVQTFCVWCFLAYPFVFIVCLLCLCVEMNFVRFCVRMYFCSLSERMCCYDWCSFHVSLYVYWCVCVCVCVVTVTMADTPDWYNQTTVNLAALHISPEPKTGHKPSSPYPWTPTLTRPIQQELTAPVHPRQAMLANCFFPLSVYPHFSFHPSLPPSLPSSSSLFIEPRPPRDIPFGWQPF